MYILKYLKSLFPGSMMTKINSRNNKHYDCPLLSGINNPLDLLSAISLMKQWRKKVIDWWLKIRMVGIIFYRLLYLFLLNGFKVQNLHIPGILN